ncbi:MAG: bifunctional folylpolyglutamate synthase/dihydrofolate synthase [Bacteroidaceae bacterium]|nr:bifunctional folylpolyglutamate synthase/dihydrofolate synthase [Bacteroidaceae bacterium]
MSDYDEALEWLMTKTPMFQNTGSKAYKEGLDNTLLIDKRIGYPHKSFPSIHIAGTNGKGSVAHTLAAILQASGLKTGLYTSPHLVDFRERIKINGTPIQKDYVVKFIQKYRAFLEPLSPSFFEVTTAMAFDWFANQKADVAVIETGLGGRLDCTNIITPILSIITNIGYDHMQLLGDTLSKIAAEKAGIIKPHVPVIIGEYDEETAGVFREKAAQVNSPIIFAQDECKIISQQYINPGMVVYETTDYPGLNSCLTGYCQANNANTILTATDILIRSGIKITEQDIRNGFRNVCSMTGLAGRWQTISEKPITICDTGHNSHGFRYIVRQLEDMSSAPGSGTLRIVIGMAGDKDISHVLKMIPNNSVCYFTQASVKRAADSHELRLKGIAFGLKGEAFSTVREAYEKALYDSSDDDIIFIGGSTFVVADFLSFINLSHSN